MIREEEYKSEADFSYDGNYKDIQKRAFIEKACKWLEDYLYEYTTSQEFIGTLCRYVHKKDAINEFRKAMEE